METRVILCVVENRETVLLEFCKYLLKIFQNKEVYGIFFWEGKRKPIWYMRRKLIERALNAGATHVLFIDTDTIPPNGFVQHLLAHNLPIVTGVYYGIDGMPCSVKNGTKYIGKGLCGVDVAAMGAALIKREVLEKIEYPQPDPADRIDADDLFFKLCKEAGYKVAQDFGLRSHHLLLGAF